MMIMTAIVMMILAAMAVTCGAASLINSFFDMRSGEAVRGGRTALGLR